MSNPERSVLVADIGKTRCRIRLTSSRTASQWNTVWAQEGDGTQGLAAAGSIDTIVHRMLDLTAARPDTPLDIVAIGVAGALAAPANADLLANGLATAFGTRALVTSDIVTAHLGALGGGPGTVLIAGTGAVAMGIVDDGTTTLIDGAGPEVGDLGSGSWIGRAGISAALRARDGAAPPTLLTRAFDDLLGPSADLQRWLTSGGNIGGRLGSFAPMVLACAELGDAAAEAIASDAVRMLAATTIAATRRRRDAHSVCVLGGLADNPGFRHRLLDALTEAGLPTLEPLGTALDGACIAAVIEHLPHERLFHRA